MVIKLFILSLVICSAQLSQAKSGDDNFTDHFAKNLRKVNANLNIESVEKSVMPGMKEVQLEEGPTIYAHESGDFMIVGNMYSLAGEHAENLTQKRIAEARKLMMADVKKAKAIVYSPKSKKVNAKVYIFTDVDCGYCRKIHQEVPELNEAGIEVHYLAFPRAGVGSSSYDKLVTAWCSDDPNDAMDKLKAGIPVKNKTCENTVAKQYNLGQKIGVKGTPAIFLEDGTLIPGYKPAKKLIRDILAKSGK